MHMRRTDCNPSLLVFSVAALRGEDKLNVIRTMPYTCRSALYSDKARIASILNSFKNDPFYTHLVSLFAKQFSI